MIDKEKHPLQEMIDSIARRDERDLDELHGWLGTGPTIENQIALADNRAVDALMAACILARYIMEKEAQETTDEDD